VRKSHFLGSLLLYQGSVLPINSVYQPKQERKPKLEVFENISLFGSCGLTKQKRMSEAWGWFYLHPSR
jgi:hypothetical protein